MLKLGKFLGIVLAVAGLISTVFSSIAIVYVIIESSYELRIFQFTLHNPDVQLLLSALISFLAGFLGLSIYNQCDLLLLYKKEQKNHRP